MMHKLAIFGSGLALACSFTAATTSVASAASLGGAAEHSATVHLTKAPPSCVKSKKFTTDNGYRSYKVTNGCKTTKKVKVVFKRAYDSKCTAIKPKETRQFIPNVPIADWDRVEAC
ncbi:hypothetical protein ACFV3R_06445 [Streptomyces sp. NPDC059740]|uniref:hypothetical protein n=1 Tax=Streptomyces sp. NPDC059740 TaxID=3346926 RepID=UPI00364CCA88